MAGNQPTTPRVNPVRLPTGKTTMTTTTHTATLAAFFGPEHWPPATVTEICTLTAWALGGPEWPAASVTITRHPVARTWTRTVLAAGTKLPQGTDQAITPNQLGRIIMETSWATPLLSAADPTDPLWTELNTIFDAADYTPLRPATLHDADGVAAIAARLIHQITGHHFTDTDDTLPAIKWLLNLKATATTATRAAA
ncbi:hypothetical protein [Propionibacterium freudenreichii]|uniref:hypothetical protein n=1 Tax=Propionibacterium freudenreichii TaxID=1744 RepID=UPI00254DACCA|nr:hypothetical protein [Propionibacterium freudenreichii]MDK9676558.1 hypothetical protein [Propionibacterium freudenreichii]